MWHWARGYYTPAAMIPVLRLDNQVAWHKVLTRILRLIAQTCQVVCIQAGAFCKHQTKHFSNSARGFACSSRDAHSPAPFWRNPHG